MKKIISFLTALCILSAILLPLPSAQAASKTVRLKEGKTYRYDLNGDKKKEKIKVTCKEVGMGKAKTNIYINGKKFFSRKRYALGAEFYLADLNKKDRYKEIIVHMLDSSDASGDFFALRYKGKNKKLILNGSTKQNPNLKSASRQLRLSRFSFLSNTGNNKLYIKADTPYFNFYFGSYYVKVPVAVKSKTLIGQKLTTYQTLGYTKKYIYELNRSMTLYAKASTGSRGVTCYSGSRFKALAIKPVEKNKDTGALFVKVKMTTGKTGWLYFPDYSQYNTEYLKNRPGWG